MANKEMQEEVRSQLFTLARTRAACSPDQQFATHAPITGF